MFKESDLLLISGLQHLAFCERQWGLIHLEQIWTENQLTAEGKVLHERAHREESESRGNLHIARSLRLRSLRLGLAGVADIVEYHRIKDPAGGEEKGVCLTGKPGLWRIFPVEYKRGRPKAGNCDRVQLCAQALCLEEMSGCSISEGALYYGEPQRRNPVSFDASLRADTERLVARMHELYGVGITPPGHYASACKSCSLFELCRPNKIANDKSATRFVTQQLLAIDREDS